MTADEIFRTQVESWGKRDLYLVTEEEFSILSSDADVIETQKKDNGDGTFYSALIYKGHKFVAVTS